MDNQEYKKRFDKLYNLLANAWLYFYVWKGLQEKEYEEVFSQNKYFWSAVVYGLEDAWLSSLSKIYEDSKYSKNNKVISVLALMLVQKDGSRKAIAEKIVKANIKIITSIKNLRNNSLAHNNAKFHLGSQKILQKFPIKYNDVESLLKDSGEILHNLDPDSGNVYAFEPFSQWCISDVNSIIEQINYFSKERKKHLDKFMLGKTDDSTFPPNTSKNQIKD